MRGAYVKEMRLALRPMSPRPGGTRRPEFVGPSRLERRLLLLDDGSEARGGLVGGLCAPFRLRRIGSDTLRESGGGIGG